MSSESSDFFYGTKCNLPVGHLVARTDSRALDPKLRLTIFVNQLNRENGPSYYARLRQVGFSATRWLDSEGFYNDTRRSGYSNVGAPQKIYSYRTIETHL